MKDVIGIVEANDHIASILKTVLHKQYKLIICRDFAELLYHISNVYFAAYIIDFICQDKQITKLIYHIKSSEYLKNNPIILLKNEDRIPYAIEMQVDEIIQKPFDPLFLKEKIDKLFSVKATELQT